MNWEVKGSPTFKIKVGFIFQGIQSPAVSGAVQQQGAKKVFLVFYNKGKAVLNHEQ